VEDHAVLARDEAVALVGEADGVEREVGAALADVPGAAAVRRLEDLPAVADHEGAILGERLHVVEAVGGVDGAIGEGDHFHLVVAAERERQEDEPPGNPPATHEAPPPRD
jgi:hypothetical protein